MPARVTLRLLPVAAEWSGPAGTDLPAAAAEAGVLVERPCGGKGLCGKCRVRLVEGRLEPGEDDLRTLAAEEIASGWRLACRAVLAGPVTVELPPTSLEAAPKTFGPDDLLVGPGEPAVHVEAGDGGWVVREEGRVVRSGRGPVPTLRGIAADIGTTTLAVALVDLRDGGLRATASALNPQVRWGADVISRVAHAGTGADAVASLHRVLAGAVGALIRRCLEEAGDGPDSVFALAAVGNPTMLHTLRGLDPSPLGRAPYRAPWAGAWRGRAHELGFDLPPHVTAYIPPAVRSHVGADAVAAVVAAGLDQGRGVRLLLDLGTNTEVVLSSGGQLLCASAAAGPAFEGATIHHGMRAVGGAIDRVWRDRGGGLGVRAVGGETPVGLCGSGLLDAAAALLAAGVIEPSGRMRSHVELEATRAPLADRVVEDPDAGRAFVLAAPAGRRVLLTAGDVRELQLVKGSVAAGVGALLEEAGVEAAAVEEVLVSGAFGAALDPVSLAATGLVPGVAPERVRPVGNAAGAGARLLLVDAGARRRAEAAAERALYVELAGRPGYQEAFARALAFPPPAMAPGGRG